MAARGWTGQVGMVAEALAIVLVVRSALGRLACLALWLPLVWWSAVPIGFTADQAAIDEPSSYDAHILCPHTEGSWVLISASWFAGC